MTQSASIRPAPAPAAFPTAAAIILGAGLGIFFDGIVLHQLLQWHHLVSNWSPAETVEGMEFNTYWDGMLHSLAYVSSPWGCSFCGAPRAAPAAWGPAGGWRERC